MHEVAVLLRFARLVVAIRFEIVLEIGASRLHFGPRRRFRRPDALDHQHIVLHLVQHIVDAGLGLEFLCTEPRPRRGPALFLPGKIDHTVVLLRLQCYQVEVQFVGDAVDVFVGQRVSPARIAEYGREIPGDMLARPQQRRKAVFPA